MLRGRSATARRTEPMRREGSIGAALAISCEATTRSRSALLHYERLKGASQRAVLVVQNALGEARACAAQQRARVEADPLALRLALQVDREIGVDEQEAVEGQYGADAVAEVGRRHQPRQRRERLVCKQRMTQAHPNLAPPRRLRGAEPAH